MAVFWDVAMIASKMESGSASETSVNIYQATASNVVYDNKLLKVQSLKENSQVARLLLVENRRMKSKLVRCYLGNPREKRINTKVGGLE
jgi:hypothetical protein